VIGALLTQRNMEEAAKRQVSRTNVDPLDETPAIPEGVSATVAIGSPESVPITSLTITVNKIN